MTTTYPGAVDSLPRPTSSTQMDATGYEGDVVIDNISDAIEAVQTELGTDPAGSFSTVKARAEALEAGSAALNSVAASGATETLSGTLAVQKVVMDEACTFTFPTPAQAAHSFVLHLSGAFTPTWPASVDWADATAPTYSSPSVFVFVTVDTGTTWLGSLVGKAFG